VNKKYKNIIWDWNGTLLDDIDICIEAMNILLKARSIPELTKNKYKQVFTFPVKNYYEQIGFDFAKEPFDIPALQFIGYYQKLLPLANLFNDVDKVLSELENKGYQQFILSAMEQQNLNQSVKNLGIDQYFKTIAGIDNHYAHSKIDRGVSLIKKHKINTTETLMIGDTLHDLEVADRLGIHCILIAQGHQNYNRLNLNGNIVLSELSKLLEIL